MVKLCWHFSSHVNGLEKYISEVTLWRGTLIDLDSLQENDTHLLSPSSIYSFIYPPTIRLLHFYWVPTLYQIQC